MGISRSATPVYFNEKTNKMLQNNLIIITEPRANKNRLYIDTIIQYINMMIWAKQSVTNSS